MARATIRTLLSLNQYAKIMGINPMHFNSGNPVELASGRILFPMDNAQNNIWVQHSYQNFDMVSREELAQTIYTAEQEIANALGYFPMYSWVQSERHELPRHYRPELDYYPMMTDIAGRDIQVKLDFSKFVAGGREKRVLLNANVPVIYSDADTDGYDETATITVPDPGFPLSEIRIYIAGYGGEDYYELRDPKSQKLSGANLVTKYNAWELILPALIDAYPSSEPIESVNTDDPTTLITFVEVYHVYNDTTQNHVVFYASNKDGTNTTQGGFLDYRGSDFIAPLPANYDTTLNGWQLVSPSCVYADYVELWYYSGMGLTMPLNFQKAIAYMATARLERVFYSNNNATSLAESLRQDYTVSIQGQFVNPPKNALTNPFGTKRGEVIAWNLVQEAQHRRVGGSL